jgi:RHS repeat-associated protein
VSASYTFDANSNRLSMVESTGTTSYSYDELDRMLSVTAPGPTTVGYRYDLDGNRRKVIYPDNTAVTYAFDAASRMQSLTDWASRTTSYSYFADGLVQSQTNFNSTSTSFSYDNARRLTQILNQKGSSTVSQHTYTLDSVGNRTQLAEVLAQVGGGTLSPTTTYSYDHLYRLVADGTNNYTYDPVGNRLTGPGSSLSYDRADRLAFGTGCSVDANGNVTLLGCVGGGQAAYDAANRLTSTRALGNSAVSNTYDGDGKRVSKNVQGPSTYIVSYVYDVSGGLPVVLQDQITGGGAPPGHKYVWGATGMAYSVDTNNIVLVSHTDGLSSVRALTDVSGNLVQTYQTGAFGVPTQTSGTATQNFQYTGELGDENGLVDLRARMYDPVLGRFLQRDPIAGRRSIPMSLNRFVYVSDNPVRYTDPSGRTPSNNVLQNTSDTLASLLNSASAALSTGGGAGSWSGGGYTGGGGGGGGSIGFSAAPGGGGSEAESVAAGGSGASTGGSEWARVGRWMSRSEYDAMLESRVVQEGAGGQTSVLYPADPAAYAGAARGSIYVEFDVPATSLAQGGTEGWFVISGPNSLRGRLAVRRGEPIPQMPPARNIEWLASRI